MRLSAEAVKAKTGRVWANWFKILGKAGAKKSTHKDIAAYLDGKQRLGPWSSQMVAAA